MRGRAGTKFELQTTCFGTMINYLFSQKIKLLENGKSNHLIMVDPMLGHPSNIACLVLAINCTYAKAPSTGCCKVKIIVHVILFFSNVYLPWLSAHATQVGMALYGTCRCRRPKVRWLLWGKVCCFHFYWYVNQHYINHAILHS